MDAQQIRQLKPKLTEFLTRFDDCFPRCDTRQHLPVYVEGQLSDLERKSVEPIALKANVSVRTLQEFLSQHRWDEDLARQRYQEIVAEEHASPRTIGIIDDTSDAKKGTKTPGVQVQYCGAEGKKDNCIVTVHLGLAVDDFHCLLDGELFLPESWSNDRKRCREAGIPDTMVYRSKLDIALELYDRARANGIRFAWLTFDGWYGRPPFLRALDARGQLFVGQVRQDFTAWTRAPRVTKRPFHRVRPHGGGQSRRTPRVIAGSPKAITVEAMMRWSGPLRDQAWKAYRVKDGEKGPMVWEVKHMLIYPKGEDRLPARPYHLVVSRNVLDRTEIKYFVSNAPVETSVQQLLLVGFYRSRIERCFEDHKGEVGLDHYEGRRYLGLKRHLILTAVSYLFLSRIHQELRGEKSGVNRLPSPHGGGSRSPQLVAIRPSLQSSVRAGSGRNPVRAEASRPSPQEPHESYPSQATGRRHKVDGPPTLSLGYDLAL